MLIDVRFASISNGKVGKLLGNGNGGRKLLSGEKKVMVVILTFFVG